MTASNNQKGRKKKSSLKLKEDLTLNAYNAIRKMLLLNEIAIGQKIHYPNIAKQLNMSSTPVIQALKWMQFQGLVRHESNQGFYLEDISIEEVQVLYEIRLSVETTLLRRAMPCLDDSGIERVRTSLNEFMEASQKKLPKIRIVKDIEFHMTLASLSGSRTGRLILQQIFDLLYLKYRTYLLMLKSGESSHKKIFECLEKYDIDGAVMALTNHIRGVGEDIVMQLHINMEEKRALKMI